MACPWSETALAFRTIKFTSNHYWILYSFFCIEILFLLGTLSVPALQKERDAAWGFALQD